MSKKLIIVESSTKSKIIKQYLGSNWNVIATSGHFKNINIKKGIKAIQIEKDSIEVDYITNDKVVENIIKNASGVDEIYLASDKDREGELIALNVQEVLVDSGIKVPIHRISYVEITKEAILEAINNKTSVNINLAMASKARSVLDFIFGFKISPLLWKTVPFAKSSGRLQACSLALICSREEEILNSIIKKFYIIKVKMGEYLANKILHISNEDNRYDTEEKAILASKDINNDKIKSFNIIKKNISEGLDTRLKTTTMQKIANTKLHWSSKTTMSVAQSLYEGVEIDGKKVALITYPRTDSTNYSNMFISTAQKYIESTLGKDSMIEKLRTVKTKPSNTQEAHEAIRPTYINITPESIEKSITKDQYLLYKIIWEESLIYFLKDAQYTLEYLNVEFSCGSKVTFLHKCNVYLGQHRFKSVNTEKDVFNTPGKLEVGTIQSQTKLRARYNEGSLIKELEDRGVGRPSTYATIVDTLLSRGYILKQNNALIPTKLGIVKNLFIKQYFQELSKLEFTQWMEQELNNIVVKGNKMEKLVYDFNKELNQGLDGFEGDDNKIYVPQIVEDLHKRIDFNEEGSETISDNIYFKNSYFYLHKNEKITGFINSIECKEEDSPDKLHIKSLTPFHYKKNLLIVKSRQLLKFNSFKSFYLKDEELQDCLKLLE